MFYPVWLLISSGAGYPIIGEGRHTNLFLASGRGVLETLSVLTSRTQSGIIYFVSVMYEFLYDCKNTDEICSSVNMMAAGGCWYMQISHLWD